MQNVIIPAVVGTVAAVVAYAEGKDDGEKKQKKRYRRAEAARQRQIALQKQEQQKTEKRRRAIANSESVNPFTNKSILGQFWELKPFKPCSLSKTFERVANADGDMEELQRIEGEMFCASMIEEICARLEQKQQEIYEMLEEAYRNRDFRTLQAILLGGKI